MGKGPCSLESSHGGEDSKSTSFWAFEGTLCKEFEIVCSSSRGKFLLPFFRSHSKFVFYVLKGWYNELLAFLLGKFPKVVAFSHMCLSYFCSRMEVL